MIVCHCHVLTKQDIISTVPASGCPPRSAAHAHSCLGCAPQCGRCLKQVRAIIEEAGVGLCANACGKAAGREPFVTMIRTEAMNIAAE